MRGNIYTRLLALLLAFVLAVPWSAVATAAGSTGSAQEEAADASANNAAVNADAQNDVGKGITENSGAAVSSAAKKSAAKSGAVKGNASASDAEPEIPVSGKGDENAGNVFSAADVTELAAGTTGTFSVILYPDRSKKNGIEISNVSDGASLGEMISEHGFQDTGHGWTVIEQKPGIVKGYWVDVLESSVFGVSAEDCSLTVTDQKNRLEVYPTDKVTVRLYKDLDRQIPIRDFKVMDGCDLRDLINQLGEDCRDRDWYYTKTPGKSMSSTYLAGSSFVITSDLDACFKIPVGFYWSDPEQVKETGNELKLHEKRNYGEKLADVLEEFAFGKGLEQVNWKYRKKSGETGKINAEELSEYSVKEPMDLWLDFEPTDGHFCVTFCKENPSEISMKKKNAALDNLIYLFANQTQGQFSSWTSKLSGVGTDMVWTDGDDNIASDEVINTTLNVWYGTHTVQFYWKNPAENGTGPYNYMATEKVRHGDLLWENVINTTYGVAWGRKYLDKKDWHVISSAGRELGVLNGKTVNTDAGSPDIKVTEDLTVWVDAGLLVRICNDYPLSFEFGEAAEIVSASEGDEVSQIVKNWLEEQTGEYLLKDAVFVTGSGKDADDVHDLTDADVVGDEDVIVWVKTFEVSVYDRDPSGAETSEQPLATYPEIKSYSTVGDALKKFVQERPEYSKLTWNKSLTDFVREDMKLWPEKAVALSYTGQPEVFYSSMQEALEAIPEGAENAVVRLLKDVDLMEDADSMQKPFTLNLDGHQLNTGKNKLIVDSLSEIMIESGSITGEVEVHGKLTVTGTAQAGFGTLTVRDGAEVLLNAPVSVQKICLDGGCYVNAGAAFELTGDAAEICFLSDLDVLSLNGGKKLTVIRPQDGAALSTQISQAAQMVTLSDKAILTKLNKEVMAMRDVKTGDLVAMRVAKRIYVNSGAGDDEKNSGFEPDKPVKTFTKAKELLEQALETSPDPDMVEGIYVTGTIEVTGSETWSLPKNTKLMRYDQKNKSRKAQEVSTFTGNLVNVSGTLTLKDIVIDGSLNAKYSDGAIIRVTGGSLTIGSGTVLQNNLHRDMSSDGYLASGGAVYAANGTVTMTGGEIKGNESWYGGGVCLNGSTFIMSGGSIHNNTADVIGILNQDKGGGGIAAACGSMVKLSGGTVKDNVSHDVGGGISIGLPQENTVKEISRLTMTGGTVSGNTADGRGGGIFIQSNCEGRISAGNITGNKCLDRAQFAGGGIYVNGIRSSVLTGVEYDAGALYLTNVKITGNTASGSGGVAGCNTSTTNIYRNNGGIIYDNAGAEVYIDNGLYYTQPRGTISEFGMNNTRCNWTENGKPVASESDDHANRKCLKEVCRTLRLESAPDNAAAAAMAATVDISGNKASGGGGGIATNGYLQIGEPGGTSVTAKKLWDDAKNADKLRPEGIDDVKVWLLRDGKRVGYYNFSKNNDGTWPESLTIENLPEGNYTIEEELPNDIVYRADGTVENPNKTDAVYEASFEKDGEAFVVTNHLKRDLVISKTVSGYVPETLSDVSYSFRVKLNLTDGAKVQAELFSGKEEQGKKVTASVSGGMLQIGGSTVIKLKSGERLLLKSLPENTRYEVSETDIPAGITPSVKVTETGADGTVSDKPDGTPDPAGRPMASGTMKKGGSTTEVAFTNSYKAAGTWIPSGTKTLTGRDMAAGEFRFTVKEAEKTVSEGVNAAAGNGQAAAIGFTEIAYTLADVGTHTYVIAEDLTGLPEYVTGDSHTYTVRVEVSDQGDGTLKADAIYTDGTTEAALAEFKNVYEDKREITVTFDKVNAQTGASLAGAVLRVAAADGTEIETWTSDGKPHQITGKLTPGVAYRLIEVSAPAGYQIAADITFEAADGGQVVMKDEEQPVVPNPGTVAVTKNLVLNGNPMGAEDQTFYVALYEDAACTKRVSDIRPVVFKKTSSSTVEFTGLPAGKVYYVGESDANGSVLATGTVADGTVFAANFQNGNTAETRAGRTTRVTFVNEFYELPQGFYREGELTITKKLLTADGSPLKSDEVFYAGIFADREHSVLSDQVSENIVALELGGKSKISVTVPVALTEGQVQKLYVTETDENGVPVDSDFAYEVTVQGGAVSMDTESPKASVTITNQELPEETETELETEKQTEKKKEAVKTGDDTPIAVYISLMAAALIVLLLLVFWRRRKK